MEKTTGTILGPDGNPAHVPVLVFDEAEARIFREYKKILQRYGLQEALRCVDCHDANRPDGTRAFVTSAQIVIECRCKIRFHQGYTV